MSEHVSRVLYILETNANYHNIKGESLICFTAKQVQEMIDELNEHLHGDEEEPHPEDMTAEQFKALVGRDPENDDLDRVNCSQEGKPGHLLCGRCSCGRPKFICFPDCKARSE